MADKDGIRTEDGQDGAENKRTFSYMMDHPDEVQGPAVSTQDQETLEEKEARERAEAETAAAAAGGPEGETPEAKAAREAAEAEADKTKDWTVEDFRKGYKEAETRMHTATGETAKEKEAREAAEKRAEVAEAKLVEQEVEREKLAAEAAKPKSMTEDEQDAIFEKAASQLRDLDIGDPDYLRDYGRIMRKAVTAVSKSQVSVDPDTTANEVATKAWEQFQARQTAESVKTAEERQREDEVRVESNARDLGIKTGLDLGDPDSADSIIWDRMKTKIPQEVFDKGTLEAQVEWVAVEVRKRTGKVVQQTDAERKQVAEAQRRNTVMGKGVNFTPSKETPKKRTLSEVMDQISP